MPLENELENEKQDKVIKLTPPTSDAIDATEVSRYEKKEGRRRKYHLRIDLN